MNPKSVVILAVSLIFFLSFLVSWIFSFSSLNLYLYLNLYLFQLIIKYPVGVQTPSRSVKKKNAHSIRNNKCAFKASEEPAGTYDSRVTTITRSLSSTDQCKCDPDDRDISSSGKILLSPSAPRTSSLSSTELYRSVWQPDGDVEPSAPAAEEKLSWRPDGDVDLEHPPEHNTLNNYCYVSSRCMHVLFVHSCRPLSLKMHIPCFEWLFIITALCYGTPK
jgi:hypothetical protein